MRSRSISNAVILFALITVPSIAAASTKAGANCSKAGATTSISGVKFRCAKSGKNLIWQKFNASAKPAKTPTLSKLAQSITTPALKSVEITQASLSGFFTATSDLPVDLSTKTPTICSVQAENVQLLQTGTCDISASQSGSSKYLPAKPVDVAIAIKPPTVTSDNALLDQVQTFIRVPLGTAYASDTAVITLTAFSNDATPKVCTADGTALGCTVPNGSGVPDPASQTRYIEFAFHVKNLDPNPLPSISYRLLVGKELSDIDAGVSLQTLNGLSIGSGESADGSLFGAVPINQDLSGAYLLIDEGITDPSVKLLLSLSN